MDITSLNKENRKDGGSKARGVIPDGQEQALRIVLVGKTGVGKSATGNTILGREAFESHLTPNPLTTECKIERTKVNGRHVCVVDTPDLLFGYSNEVKKKEIAKCISLSFPGPHVFLVVIQLGRFTQEEQKTVKLIEQIFGEKSAKYTMVLFSYGEKLKGTTIEAFLSNSKELKEFTDQCHGGYHVFNNEDLENQSQIKELLQKIDEMVEKNGGGYYTSERKQDSEPKIEEKQEGIAKPQSELDKGFIGKSGIVGGITGGITGAVAGFFVGGPVGAAVGFAVGAVGGAGMGAGVGAGVEAVKKDQCPIQ